MPHFLNKIFSLLRGAPRWREVLPVQTPRRLDPAPLDATGAGTLARCLEARGIRHVESGPVIYVPPQEAPLPICPDFRQRYPDGAGLKILQRIPDGIQQPGHLSLMANLLHRHALGPRLYDQCVLPWGGHSYPAFVVEHVPGRPATAGESSAARTALESLEEKGFIRQAGDGGLVAATGSGRLQYLAFHESRLENYESFLKTLALQAAADTHYGNLNKRGERYLYQSIPGVRLPAKRNVENRIGMLRDLMRSMAVSVEDRLVLDIGCNIGMMLAQYLKLGARWGHGWDMPTTVPHTEAILSALGCTRFSTTGGQISKERGLEADLPEFIRPALSGCVISYLAIRGHVGWIDALARIPWAFLIYEGHKKDTEADFHQHFEELKQLVRFQLSPVKVYPDGKRKTRSIAILVRKENL